MKILLIILLILIPALSLLSKVFISSLVVLFFLILLLNAHRLAIYKKKSKKASQALEAHNLETHNYHKINFLNFRTEILFFSWCFFSCFWSTNKIYAITELLKMLASLYMLIKSIQYSPYIISYSEVDNYFKYISIGILLSVIVFFIEYYTDGSITLSLRKLFQENSKQAFYMHFLDRGCVFLSLISWAVIANLFMSRRYVYSFILYLTILLLLYKSDSLSGFLGFLSGGIIYLILTLTKSKFIFNLVPIFILVVNVSVPTFFYNMDTNKLVDKYENVLPTSAIHRLFIWNYSMKKSSESLLAGYGFDASREISSNNSEIIKYKNHNIRLLPIHPHNLLVQIILELGIIGFLFYNAVILKFIQNIIKSSSKNTNLLFFMLAGFSNYYFVSMISFGIWQFWWVCTTLFLIFNFRILKDKWVNNN